MAGTVYLHTGDTGKVKWERLADDSGLGADVFESANPHATSVGIFCRPDVLADLAERLLSWPDVVTIVARRRAGVAGGLIDVTHPREIDAVAKAYFRAGFLMFGNKAGDVAVEAVRNA